MIGEAAEMEAKEIRVELAAEIVAAYVSHNPVSARELPGLIRETYVALAGAAQVGSASEASSEPQKPAIAVKKSVAPDHITCLEDGKQFKSLKRHLHSEHGLTPEQYRAKWGLPKDYPMVAPNYSEARAMMARDIGLGQKGRGQGKSRRAA